MKTKAIDPRLSSVLVVSLLQGCAAVAAGGVAGAGFSALDSAGNACTNQELSIRPIAAWQGEPASGTGFYVSFGREESKRMKAKYRSDDYREVRRQFVEDELKQQRLCTQTVQLFTKNPIGMSDVRCGVEFVAVKCVQSAVSR